MNAQRFTWRGRKNGNPAHDLIAAYLAVDIQKSPAWAKELLQKTDEVKSGQIDSWERFGNAYSLHIFPDRVEIGEDYEEEPEQPVNVPIDDFEAAVEAWLRFIK
ncbi:MAG TPA: YacL family protein [Nitrosospira sp.]|nr:YacL family protein [Nitrosospira sp.]